MTVSALADACELSAVVPGDQPDDSIGNLSQIVHRLVLSNKARLFPDNSVSVEIVGVELGPELHLNQTRFHRALTVHYRRDGSPGSVKFWLKFRPGLDRLFPVLAAYHGRLSEQLFPAPYFAWHSPDERTSFVASAYLPGTPLRDKLLWSALTGRTRQLEPVFRSHGRKMRDFHDAFPASEWIYAHEIAATVEAAVRATPFLTAPEKDAVLGHVERAAALLGNKALPAVRNHNDWILRNIVVTRDGSDYLIDVDSMRYRPNWRWYDVGFLLLNVESVRKWAPLITLSMMSRLWRAFWEGYTAGGMPDGLLPDELGAVLYLVRAHWLFDGVVRSPNFAVLKGRLNERFRRVLKRGVIQGRSSQLEFLPPGGDTV